MIFIFPQLVPVMQQPDGVSVHYLCYKMQNLAWKKYVIARKSEAGTIDKVGTTYVRKHLKLMSLCHVALHLPVIFISESFNKIWMNPRLDHIYHKYTKKLGIFN